MVSDERLIELSMENPPVNAVSDDEITGIRTAINKIFQHELEGVPIFDYETDPPQDNPVESVQQEPFILCIGQNFERSQRNALKCRGHYSVEVTGDSPATYERTWTFNINKCKFFREYYSE